MLEGLMQHDHPITLQMVLDRMRGMFGTGEVVEPPARAGAESGSSYAEIGDRVDRLCRGLESLGVKHGDRVATFAWNTQHHFEVYMAVPCMGAVLHTVNVRLFEDQLEYVVNHAEDSVMFVDPRLVRPAREARAALRERARTSSSWATPTWRAARTRSPTRSCWPRRSRATTTRALDDKQAAGLCYTSGTTGNPKGVLYSHRSNILHAMAQGLADALGMCSSDRRVMPVVPMFHANAWGLPYGAAMHGADLVMPGPYLQAEPLGRPDRATRRSRPPAPCRRSGWTCCATPTTRGADLSSMRIVACGGSAVPRSLMEAFEERHGMQIVQAWGMTETSPVGSVAHPPAGRERRGALGATAPPPGRLLPLVERPDRRTTTGDELPRDGKTTGELRCAGRGWRASTTRTRPAPRSSTTAGCAPATSPRSTSAASCGSPTAPRT